MTAATETPSAPAPAKTSKRRQRKPATWIASPNGPLYRPTMTVEIVGRQTTLMLPAFDQVALMRQYLTLALKPLISEPGEVVAPQILQDRGEARLREFQLLTEKQAMGVNLTADEQVTLGVVSSALIESPEANHYLLLAIGQCFPDLKYPEQLTSQAKMECSLRLMQALVDEHVA